VAARSPPRGAPRYPTRAKCALAALFLGGASGFYRIKGPKRVKSDGRRSKAERRPKPEGRIALGIGFRPSDFKAVHLAASMPPLGGLTNRAVRLAINMSPLRGWPDWAALAGQIRRPKREPRSASGFGIRISELGLLSAFGFQRPFLNKSAKDYYEYQ